MTTPAAEPPAAKEGQRSPEVEEPGWMREQSCRRHCRGYPERRRRFVMACVGGDLLSETSFLRRGGSDKRENVRVCMGRQRRTVDPILY